jgi:hypothetical protein
MGWTIRGSNPAGGMDVCVVCCTTVKDKRHSQDIQDKKKKIPVGVGFSARCGAHTASFRIGTGFLFRG